MKVKKHKKGIYSQFLVIVLFGISFSNLHAVCDPAIKNQLLSTINGGIAKANPYAIYGYIESAKIAAFGEGDIIAKGYNEKPLAQWNSWISCCNEYVRDQLKKSSVTVPKIYSDYLGKLELVNQKVQEYIKDLHDKSLKKPLTKADVAKAKTDLEKYSADTANYFAFSLRTIVNNLAYPDLWKNPVNQATLIQIFPKYEQFFAAYNNLKKNTLKNTKMTSKELIYYLKLPQSYAITLPKYDPTKDPEVVTETALTRFFDTLEKFVYKLGSEITKLNGEIVKQQEVVDKAWIKGDAKKKLTDLQALLLKYQTMRADGNDVMSGLLNAYLLMIPLSYFMRLQGTKDASSVIILAESSSLNGVIQVLLRSINKIK